MANDFKFFFISLSTYLILALTFDLIYFFSLSVYVLLFDRLFYSEVYSIFLSLSFSYLNSLMILSTALSLTMGLFLIFFVWSAYLRVDRVSS